MARLANPALAERRRSQIMEAAVACFRRRGFHQTTMAEICAAAEISAGALYHYFGSKSEIIGAIVEDAREGANTVFLRTAEEKGLIEALCTSSSEFFQRLMDGDGALFAEVMAESIRDEAVSVHMRRVDEGSVRMMSAALKAAQERGEIDPDLDVILAANTLSAVIEGIGLRRAFLRDTDAAIAISQFRALLERYLGKRS